MYVSVSSFLHSGKLPTLVQGFYIYIQFLISFVLLIVMTSSASGVAEASTKIRAKAWRMSIKKEDAFSHHQKLILLVEKGISLTVWKVVPINRNIIYGLLGDLFTYIILLDSLNLDGTS
ncbi:hypothetical protein NPIL_586731 [Nephila pilipes]|uniref:Uncharacterized protein n=1 Tax=Nephila pilipes TaxID=299642 RepID=A0A8X6QFA3_NEPPI|nr:hypothetical protein NPIL_586731 [Nephila pilipes]